MSRYTRRGVLATGAALSVAVAGCLGDPPGASPDELDPNARPLLGSTDAPVRVTLFEDFGCPSCAQFNQNVLPGVEENHVSAGNAHILHVDYPIPVDEQWSYPVASAARAVFEEAGNDAFWSFADEMYANQDSFSMDLIERTADEIANVGAAARQAAEEGTYRSEANSDRDLGRDWGVNATPTVFVGDSQVEPSQLGNAIAQQL
jgi:protein-disulfide isomerase